MDMNLFYRRIFDFREVINNKLAMAIISSEVDASDEDKKNIISKVNAAIEVGYNDMVASLQTLEEKEKLKNKKTRRRKK